jgi:hypothetical protein
MALLGRTAERTTYPARVLGDEASTITLRESPYPFRRKLVGSGTSPLTWANRTFTWRIRHENRRLTYFT